MSVEVGLASGRSVRTSAVLEERNRDRRFFTGMAIAAALTVFVGFAPTYYLRGLFDARPLSPLVHLHGIVSTAWILLFLTQTSLVAARRTDLHRRLGIVGVVLAVGVLGVGFVTAVTAARNGVTPPGGPPPLAFLSVPLGTLFAFGLLAATGLYNRRRSETHRRLMLLATIAILTPAIARFRHLGFGGPPLAIGGTCAFVLVCFCYDRLAHGRIHPAFLWGGLLLMLSLPARFALGRTETWLAFASWLTR
jgi:FtsH-binding integral membrane protein